MDTSDIGTSTSGRGRGRRGATTPVQPATPNTVVLGPRDSLIGSLTVEGDVRIEGTLQGDVSATGEVSVQSSGNAHARIEARDIVIAGQVEGSAVARDLVVLADTATFAGEVRSSRLRVDEGATMNATVAMSGSGDAPPARRMEEHDDEATIDVTGSAFEAEAGEGAYAEVSTGAEPDAYSEDRAAEISAIASGSDSSEG